MMDFSKILKQERKKQNLTQFELAELLNVSDKTISSWENGRSYPDVKMLKSISEVLKIDVNTLLDAEDFCVDVKNISKEELIKNHDKENKYVKDVIISICLNLFSLLIPIIHITLTSVYNLKQNHPHTPIPNFREYEKISKIVFPILVVIAVIMMFISITKFIISSVDFKKYLIDTNYNTRYKLIFSKNINLYVGCFIMTLFLVLNPMYENYYWVGIAFSTSIIIYLIINLIISKLLNVKQNYNKISILLIILIGLLCVCSIVCVVFDIVIILILLLISMYISMIILLSQKK